MPEYTHLHVGINGTELVLRFDSNTADASADASAFIAAASISPSDRFVLCWDDRGRRVYVRPRDISYIRPGAQR